MFPRKTKKRNSPRWVSSIKTRITQKFHQVRIIPKGVYYILEIVYSKDSVNLNLDKSRIIGIDLGINNIVTVANNIGIKPIIVKGNFIKSINQFYNKQCIWESFFHILLSP